jgi:phosphoadenosine phosphosulfate reductase
MNTTMTETNELIDFFAQKIHEYQDRGLKVFASSSFQTHSIPMLHILSNIDKSIPIYFLNTGYHFPETLAYRDQIGELLGIEIKNLSSPIPKFAQRDNQNFLMFASNPDNCCYLNKTLPMETVLAENDVWISGVRRDQNLNRSKFTYEAEGAHNTLRFHPMLDWTNKMIFDYIKKHQLPKHPLEEQGGYMSIGCEPCTKRIEWMTAESERTGRWFGLNKTECGLHTDLMK